MPDLLNLGNLFPDEKQLEDERIYLMFITKIGLKKCDVSGKCFETWFPIGFFVDRYLKRPVAPSVALEHGFTMDYDDRKES